MHHTLQNQANFFRLSSLLLGSKRLSLIVCFGFIFFVSPVLASDSHSGQDSSGSESEFNPVTTILHHVLDNHDWHLFDLPGHDGHDHPVSIPLPIILYSEGQFDLFMSSAFEHGHAQVNKGDRVYALDEHGHILDLAGHSVLDFSITKNVASMLVAVLLLLLIFMSGAKSYEGVHGRPVGIAKVVEPLVLFVRDDIAIPNIGHNYKRYMPYLLTAFFFIWINNLLGLIPSGANFTGNISVTATLAVFTLLITNFSGTKTYWGHIFTPHVPLWLYPIMIPVEMVGIVAKPIALMIRLFANITAGHIIILSLVSLIFVFKSLLIAPVSLVFVLFISCIELLVAALQAYVFTLLSALFIGLALEEPHLEAHH
ncbi:MAG: F0F1 ATP synthase subunit A [Bacteroidetes bacterium]|nr:F0F1 ATP synthase subunit A [Bacteroidota bacterium]